MRVAAAGMANRIIHAYPSSICFITVYEGTVKKLPWANLAQGSFLLINSS